MELPVCAVKGIFKLLASFRSVLLILCSPGRWVCDSAEWWLKTQQVRFFWLMTEQKNVCLLQVYVKFNWDFLFKKINRYVENLLQQA